MLIRISLILAILAGLAAGVLNFVMVKDKITTIQSQREDERTKKETAQNDLRDTKKTLENTRTELTNTKKALATTTDERDTALKGLDEKTKLAARLKDDLDKRTKERDDAQNELAAYKATNLKPEQIMAINREYKGLQTQLEEKEIVIVALQKKVQKLANELAIYKTPDYQVPLPATLKGKVLVMDPKWNFVVLDIGEDQGVLEQGELLVNRNGKLVAKVKVRSVQKDRCIANIMPGWQLGDVIEGDLVIPAHPAS